MGLSPQNISPHEVLERIMEWMKEMYNAAIRGEEIPQSESQEVKEMGDIEKPDEVCEEADNQDLEGQDNAKTVKKRQLADFEILKTIGAGKM